MKPHRWIVKLASRIVPRALRSDWADEWNAELHHREATLGQWKKLTMVGRWRLFARSTGAVWDALWLQSSGWQSLRFLIRYRRIAAMAVLSLGAAMAATIICFGVYEAFLLRSLGVRAPQELVTLRVRTPTIAIDGVSDDDFDFYRANNRVFADMAGYPNDISWTQTPSEASNRALYTAVSTGYFDVLGVRPRLGTLSFPANPAKNDAPTELMVISERYWRRLGSDPKIVGRAFHLGAGIFRVIGVVPASFHGMIAAWQPDVWLPLAAVPAATGVPAPPPDRRNRSLYLIGRLRPGVTAQQAENDVTRLSAQLMADHPDTDKDRKAFLTPMTAVTRNMLNDDGSTSLIFGAVVGVAVLTLIAACVNVTNLLLGLAMTRRHEMLVRAALGASRLQLMLPVLRESVVLGIASGGLGLAGGTTALTMLSDTALPLGPDLPMLSFDVRPDLVVLVITTLVVLMVSLGVGLVPAWRAAADGISGALTRELAVTGTKRQWSRNALTAIQIAVATVVLFGVGVSLRSIDNLRRVDVGFSAKNLVFAQLTTTQVTPAGTHLFFERLRAAAAAVPGVQSVALASGMPIDNCCERSSRVRPEGSTEQGIAVPLATVDDQYFKTMGIKVISGRTFDARDALRGKSATEVIVINHEMANSRWLDVNPVGKRLQIDAGNRFAEVIGVVADGKYEDLDEQQLPIIYYPLRQEPAESITVIARTAGPARTFTRPIRDALESVDPTAGVGSVRTWDDAVYLQFLGPNLVLMAIGSLSALALLLTMVGLYGTVFHAVSQRRKELGIRVALGAQPRHLLWLVLRQTLIVAAVGALIGVGVSQISLPIISAALYGIRPVEFTVTMAVASMALLTALAVAYVAARPWTRMSAMDIVRRD